MNKKISVLGIDGANKKIAQKMKIENFSNFHDLISTIPPYTPPSWTSIITGVNPGKHGIYGFRKYQKKSSDICLNTSNDVKYNRIFEILDGLNLKSIYINVPLTNPFSGIKSKENSIIVSDWASPKQTIYPPEIHNKYIQQLLDPPHEWKISRNIVEYLDRIRYFLDIRMNIYYDLINNYEWNIFFIVFSEIDWILHRIPSLLDDEENEQVNQIFEKINEFIQVALKKSDVSFIVSDHGFEKKDTLFHVNELFKRKKIIHQSGLRSNFIKKTYDILPNFTKKALVSNLKNKSILKYQINLSETNAVMVEPPGWGVHIDENKEKIIKILREQPEIKNVFRREDLYYGKYLNDAPDIILIPNTGIKFSHNFNDSINETINIGDHEVRGVIGVSGKNIKENIIFNKTPNVYDIVPTLLYILDIEIPKGLDGRVLKEIFKRNLKEKNEINIDRFNEKVKIRDTIRKINFNKITQRSTRVIKVLKNSSNY